MVIMPRMNSPKVSSEILDVHEIHHPLYRGAIFNPNSGDGPIEPLYGRGPDTVRPLLMRSPRRPSTLSVIDAILWVWYVPQQSVKRPSLPKTDLAIVTDSQRRSVGWCPFHFFLMSKRGPHISFFPPFLSLIVNYPIFSALHTPPWLAGNPIRERLSGLEDDQVNLLLLIGGDMFVSLWRLLSTAEADSPTRPPVPSHSMRVHRLRH